MSIGTSHLVDCYRKCNRVTYNFLLVITKLDITTEKYAIDFIEKKADQYQIIVFQLEDMEREILKLGSFD